MKSARETAKRYEQVWEGDWNEWGWKGNLEMCCDCNMVHIVDYRVKHGKLYKRVTVDRRRTYAARRRGGVRVSRIK